MHRNRQDNLIATAAYQHRTELRDELEIDPEKRIKSSNTNKEDIINEKVMIPANNPSELKNASMEYLLNKLNNKSGNRLAVRGQLAHQPELSLEQNMDAVELFAKRLALDYNCIFIYATHNEKNHNKNIHTHFIASLYPLIDGEFSSKTERVYIDEDNNIIEKTDTPILRNGQLQYDTDGRLKTKKGWQTLVRDPNGHIQYDEQGKVKLRDIRVPLLDENGNQVTYKNGKYDKPEWLHRKVKKTEMEKIGSAKRTRYLWQNCLNEICKKYNVRNKESGQLLQFDFRSNAEKDKDRPISQQRIQRWKVGPYKNKKALLHNEWCDRIETNEKIDDIEKCPFPKLIEIYNIRQEALIFETALKNVRYNKTLVGKIDKATKAATSFFKGLFHEEKQKSNPENEIAKINRTYDVLHFLQYPELLKKHAEENARLAQNYLLYPDALGRKKENYYIISDVSASYKEYLKIQMIKKISRNNCAPDIDTIIKNVDGLKSKELESLSMKLKLKNEFANYEKWLKLSQEYFKQLPQSEKDRRIERTSRTAVKHHEPVPEVTSSTAKQSITHKKIETTNRSITENKKYGKSHLLDLGKEPKIEIKWQEHENHELSEMERVEKELYKDWEHIEIEPPPEKKKDDEKKL